MSKFSGVTDLYDCITIHKSFKEFKKRFRNIYIGHGNTPIKFKSIKDLVRYYPYVPWCAISEKKNGYMRLTDVSYVDILEQNKTITAEEAENYRKLLIEESERAVRDADYESTIEYGARYKGN